MTPTRFDVIIVGAGSAGSAVARQSALLGLSTLLIDRNPLDEAGARWVNAVPGWTFDAGRVPRPTFPECRGVTERFHLVAGWGPTRMTIEPRDLLDIDMRHLIARLRADATAHGAIVQAPLRVTGVSPHGHLETTDGPRHGRLIIDATGHRAALGAPTRRPAREDICAAAQAIFKLRDVPAAEAFFADHGAGRHEPVCFAGIAGGFSVIVLRLEGEDELSILTGSRPAAGFPDGGTLLDDFVKGHPWIGPRLFGGQAPIPLARPGGSLIHPSPAGPILRMGDAAGHVFAAHGSGIGLQLVAAAMLADALTTRADPGAAARTFERRWNRRFGPLLKGSDLFRRVTQRFPEGVLKTLIGRGLLSPKMMRIGLEQRVAL